MMLQAGAVIARWLVSVLGMTWRIDVVGGDNPSNLRRAGNRLYLPCGTPTSCR